MILSPSAYIKRLTLALLPLRQRLALVSLFFCMLAMAATPTDTVAQSERESLFPNASRSLSGNGFSWGAEVGSSVDMTGHDMSTLDLDIHIGFKNDFVRFAGVGVGVSRAFGSGYTFVPVYAIFRSSFRKKPSLLFLNAKAGYSFNTVDDSPYYGDFASSLGVGINLAMNRKFRSHFILSCGYRRFGHRHMEQIKEDTRNITLAEIAFGINF